MKRFLLLFLLLTIGFVIVRMNIKLRRVTAADRVSSVAPSRKTAVVGEEVVPKTTTTQFGVNPFEQVNLAQKTPVAVAQTSPLITESDTKANSELDRLKLDCAKQEAIADQFAQELRDLPHPAEDQKQKLRQLVTQAFALRQQLHKAELTAFQQRIAKVEQTIRSRDEMRDQIINRRVEDLINPDLNWDARPQTVPTEMPKPFTPPSMRGTELNTTEIRSIPIPPVLPLAVTAEEETAGPTELEGEWVLQSVSGNDSSWTPGARCRFRGNLLSWPGFGSSDINRVIVNSSSKTILMRSIVNVRGKAPDPIKIKYQIAGDTLETTFLSEQAGVADLTMTWKHATGKPFVTLYVQPWSEGEVIAADQLEVKQGSIVSIKHVSGCFVVEAGKSHLIQLSNMNASDVITAMVDVPVPSAAAYDYLSFHNLSLKIDSDEVHRLARGTAITKVIYVPNSKLAGDVPAAETLSSATADDASILAEAQKLGTVLAVVRLDLGQPGSHLGKLNGDWHLESIVGAGVVSHDEVGLRCHITGDQWTMVRGENNFNYRIEVNPHANPKTIDMTAARNDKRPVTTSRGIYRIEGDKLTIAWGIIESVRPERFDAPDVAIHTWDRIHERDRYVQLNLAAPPGTTLRLLGGGIDSNGVSWKEYVLPARLALEAGTNPQLVMRRISTHPGLQQTVSLQIPFVSSASREFLRHNAIPINFTVDEFDHTEFGRSFEKAVYLPHPQEGDSQPVSVKALVSTNVDAGTDVVAEASKIGTVLAIVRSTSALINRGTSDQQVVINLERVKPVTPLAVAVAQVNESKPELPLVKLELPLTEAEVIASIRWMLTMQTAIKFNESEKRALHKIAEQRVIPDGWIISRDGYIVPPSKPEARPSTGEFDRTKQTIELICPVTFRHITIRKEFVSVTARGEVLKSALWQPDRILDKATPLTTAVREFNAAHDTIAGQKQPPLTEREILTAIEYLQVHRNEVPAYITDHEFSVFAGIVTSMQLNEGVTIDVVPRFPGAEYDFDIWSVRLKFSRFEDPKTIIAIPVRETFIRSTPHGEEFETVSIESPGFNLNAVKRDGKVDNLRALMFAMWKYENQHKRFPAAVILGKDATDKLTMPHSWRVEILPQLGEQKLYDEYHFDEPWDSEHNKSLLNKMPAVFRSPLDTPDSTNTSYFGLVTPGFKPRILNEDEFITEMGNRKVKQPLKLGYELGTMFSNPDGAAVSECIDGTSNTVFLVEAKRPIPWTKPEDIVYGSDEPLPNLGEWYPEGWHAGFTDGRVKFLSNQNDEATVRALFTIGGGEVVKPRLFDDSK